MLMLVFLIVATAASFVVYFSALEDARPVMVDQLNDGDVSINVENPSTLSLEPALGGGNFGLTVVNPPSNEGGMR